MVEEPDNSGPLLIESIRNAKGLILAVVVILVLSLLGFYLAF